MKNVLIVNQPLNNRGDESASKALVRNLLNSFHDIQIQILFIGSPASDIDAFTIESKNVKYLNIYRKRGTTFIIKRAVELNSMSLCYIHPTTRNIIRIMRKSDVVFCAPGGICMGGFKNWEHIGLLHISKYLNKKIVYYGRSFGPFVEDTYSDRMFKKRSLELLNYFSFLSIRDSKTQELADSLNLSYYPTLDTAFLDSPSVNFPNEISSLLKKSKYIVFVPNLLIWHYTYKDIPKTDILDFYIKMLEKMLENHPYYKILMLPQTFNYKIDVELANDIYFFRDIKKAVSSENILVLSDEYSSDIQQKIISKAEFVVGARYHSIVFAINNNVPFIALSYEHKMAGLLESLNKVDRMIDITSIWDDKLKINNALMKVTCLMGSINKDEKTTELAKYKSQDCFGKLSFFINNNFELDI